MIYKLRIWIFKLLKLTDKVALVTGGSRGIGFAIAKILSDNGATVVITSKNSEKIKQAEAKISNSFGITCDIKKKNEVQNVLDLSLIHIWRCRRRG